MSDKETQTTLNAVQEYLSGTSKRGYANENTIHDINMHRGKRAKRTIDANRINKDYFQTAVIQKDLLDHYENVDWYENTNERTFT